MAPKLTPTTAASPFKTGSVVEISSNDSGFRGSWYTGSIIRRASSKTPTKYLVQYTHLFSDNDGTKPLREIIDLGQIRPVAPREKKREFNFGEEVDAHYNDGWWEGVITEDRGNGRFAVYFRSTKEQIEFGKEDLRLHREWINGVWSPPLQESKEKVLTKPVEVSTKPEDEADYVITEQNFSKGTQVEVSSDEDGFRGAWFAASVIELVGKDKYIIEYKDLRTDDDKEYVREEVDTLHIRPCPPETYVVDRFNKLDEVDALYNDGWWVGVISKLLNSKYLVYFKDTNEEMQFDHSDLRLHQDWINGKWITGSRGMKW